VLYTISNALNNGYSSPENLAPTRQIFVKFDTWVFFANLSRRLKIRYNLAWTSGTLQEDQCMFMITSRSFLLIMRSAADRNCGKHHKTDFFA